MARCLVRCVNWCSDFDHGLLSVEMTSPFQEPQPEMEGSESEIVAVDM